MTKEPKIKTIVIDPLLKLKTVTQLTTLSKASIYAKMQDGTFPKSLQLSKRAVAWRQSSIKDFIDSLVEA